MKSIYQFINLFCNKISKIPRKIEIHKYYNDDINHLKNEKDKIDSVKWSEKQQIDFESYWVSNYGIKIPDYGSKLFESISGKFNCQYIPQFFYRKVVEPYLNPTFESFFYESKNITEFLYGKVDGVYFPKTILSCMNGYYRMGNNLVSLDEAVDNLKNIGEIIIKPSIWSGSGRSVSLLNVINGTDTVSGEVFKDILIKYGNYFIIQERVINNDEIKKLSPNSLNTFRVMTYLLDGKVYSSPVALRLGSGTSVIDNMCVDGIGVGVYDDGTLYRIAHTHGQTHYIAYDRHPYTNIIFDKYYIGDISKVIEKTKEMHSHITSVGIISWDMALNDKNNPVMIEANILNQGADFVQLTTGKGLFGENTDKMLRQLPKKEFRIKI